MSYHADIMDAASEVDYAPVAWVGLGISVVCFLLAAVLIFIMSWPLNFLSVIFFLALGVAALYFLTWTYFVRFMADRGWLWLRVSEMKAAFIEKDRSLYRIIVNVSGERRNHFEHLAAYKNYLAGYERMVVLGHGKEIIWVGLPWIYRLRTPWYENTADITNPEVDPVQFLDLRERTIDYPGGEGGVIPDVDTTDPIQVRARMVVSLRVADPEKAIYSAQFFMEAIQNEIAGRWREAISNLSYFRAPQEGEGKEKLEINPDIQHKAHLNFNVQVLHTSYLVQETIGGEEVVSYRRYDPTIQFTQENLFYLNNYPAYTSAYDILMNWGVQLLDVEVRDLDPTDLSIRETIDRKSRAIAEAAARFREAEGERAYREEIGRGERVYREEVAKGILAEERARRLGVAEGMRAIVEVVKHPGGSEVLAADAAIRIAEGTDNLVTEGGISGLVAQVGRVWEATRGTRQIQGSQQP